MSHTDLGPYEKYFTKDGFLLTELINDDFIVAIKAAYNSKHYVSAMKLLLCFIDTIAYATYGDSTGGNFKAWLDKYCDLKSLGITSDELWEHRCSILHMTSLESRRVKAGMVASLIPYLGPANLLHRLEPLASNEKYYSLSDLVKSVMHGANTFIEAVRSDSALEKAFFENYSAIISDTNVEVLAEQKPV
jgi:hypothetical protein